MKIIQTPVRFYPSIGGVEKYVMDLSKELVKNNHQVKVICANEPKSEITDYLGVKIKRLGYLFNIANTNLSLTLPWHLWHEDFDIIHSHLPTPWFADWSVIIAKLKNKKSILTYHNDITGKGIGGTIAKIYNATLLKITLGLVDRIIITQSKYLEYSPYLKKHKAKIKIIPNSVDLEIFKPLSSIKKEENTLFFLSVLDEYHKYKGLDYLLEAIEIIKRDVPDIKLIIGGKGSLLNFYKDKVKKLDIENNVEFLGFIPDNELAKYYNKSEIFILPSIDATQEGFGIVLLETLACGTPVITTEIVGIAKEINEYKAGIVIEPKNTLEIVRAIKEILKNHSPYTQNLSKIAKKFDSKKIANDLLNIYHQEIAKEK